MHKLQLLSIAISTALNFLFFFFFLSQRGITLKLLGFKSATQPELGGKANLMWLEPLMVTHSQFRYYLRSTLWNGPRHYGIT